MKFFITKKGVYIIRQKQLNEKLGEKGYSFEMEEDELECRAKLVRFCCDGPDEVVLEVEPIDDSASVAITQDYKETSFIKIHAFANYKEEEVEEDGSKRKKAYFCLLAENGDVIKIALD